MQGTWNARLRGPGQRGAAPDHRFPRRTDAGQPRDSLRHQRQHARRRSHARRQVCGPSRALVVESRAATKPRCSRLTAGCTRWPRLRSIRVPCKVRWGRSIRSGLLRCMTRLPRPPARRPTRTGRRRAVVVITDGIDTASGLTPGEVSGIASAIDVPVYIMATVLPIDHVGREGALPRREAPDARTARSKISRMDRWGVLLREHALRHQQRVAPGARRTADAVRHRVRAAPDHRVGGRSRFGPGHKDHVVRARSGYMAGGPRGGLLSKRSSLTGRTQMRKPVFVVGMFALTLAVAPACATKKFVRTEVGQVNDKVATMGTSLEQTQERVTAGGGPRSPKSTPRLARPQQSANAGAAGGHRPPTTRPSRSAPRPRSAPTRSKRPPASWSMKSS